MKFFLALSLLAAGCEAGRASKARVAGVVEKRQEKATYKAYTIDQPVNYPFFKGLCTVERSHAVHVQGCNLRRYTRFIVSRNTYQCEERGAKLFERNRVK